MARDYQRLSAEEFLAADGLEGWQVRGVEATVTFATGSFVAGLDLVNRIGQLAEAANHHPDLTLRYPTLGVLLTTHDTGSLTTADLDLARQIAGLARDLGIRPV